MLRFSGGVVNPGPGPAELQRRELLHRIRRPLLQSHHIAVTSIKGGVGKTTVATLLGLVLAENRGDRVIVLDANPDAGTLADRLTGESAVTVRELLSDIDRIGCWTEVSHYTSLAGRLQVLASEQDPAAGDAFSREEYEQVCALLERFFNIIITDSGTGLAALGDGRHPQPGRQPHHRRRADGGRGGPRQQDPRLAVEHGYGALAAEAVVVLCSDRGPAPRSTRARIREHFAARCRAVVDIPHDPHLATGGRVELARLHPATRDAAFAAGRAGGGRVHVLTPAGPGARCWPKRKAVQLAVRLLVKDLVVGVSVPEMGAELR